MGTIIYTGKKLGSTKGGGIREREGEGVKEREGKGEGEGEKNSF